MRGWAMSDERFNVVFRGDIVPGQVLPEVKQRFAQVFKLEADKVDSYFSGKPVVLKKECDRATADKFKAVLQQAGALVDIKSANAPEAAPRPAPAKPAPAPAQTVTAASPVSPSATASPAITASAATTVSAETEAAWSLSARGSDLLKPDEVVVPEPVNVSIDHIQMVKRNPFAADMEDPLEPDRDVTPPELDLSSYQLSQAGGTLTEYQEFVPLEIDLSALSLDKPGADLIREDEQLPLATVEVDISGLDLAPPGGMLGQVEAPPPPPPPSTDHLSIEK